MRQLTYVESLFEGPHWGFGQSSDKSCSDCWNSSGFLLWWDFVLISRVLEELFDLQPLSLRGRNSDVIFLYKIINGSIEYPEILESINFTECLVKPDHRMSLAGLFFLMPTYSYNSCLPCILRSAKGFSTTTAFSSNIWGLYIIVYYANSHHHLSFF